MRKINYTALAVCIAIPLIVGAAAGLLTRNATAAFGAVAVMPPASPPSWLFPVVWTVLYTLMGIASYLVFSSDAEVRTRVRALTFYAVQLALNFLWPFVFFNAGAYAAAVAVIIVLWVLIIVTAVLFYRITPAAGYLFIPYILWVTFAAYLNIGVAVLN